MLSKTVISFMTKDRGHQKPLGFDHSHIRRKQYSRPLSNADLTIRVKLFAERGNFDYTRYGKHVVAAYEIYQCRFES